TAESYVASTSHRTGADLPRLIELGEWNKEQQALDIATGGGHTALAVAPYVAQITVSDLTPTMLEKAREFLLSQGVTNAVFVEADAEHLSFPDGSFDRVTCRIAPHHFPNIAQAVKEVARVLKSGGLFLLIDNIAPADPELDFFINKVEKWRDPSHGRACTGKEWQKFFSQAGLRVEHVEYIRKKFHYDDWTARAQLPADEKAALERFILDSKDPIQRHFEVKVRSDGHLESIAADAILLKGRKV
ncbi:MAG: class I SAM-dependent methyltransferase, partial [Ktedonobacteraceae bacterium]|nr:class I SAM-dependent methyltransferase [Ktedonobacteraceae bacterium]